MGESQSFGEWLRHRRREQDLTQAELGHRVGCAPVTIQKIEADQMRPSKQLAGLLMEQLQVATDERESFIRFARGGELTESIIPVEPRDNLPIQLTSFIGREKEIAEIKDLVADNRLVTLTGVGGIGKTRLSLQVSAELLN